MTEDILYQKDVYKSTEFVKYYLSLFSFSKLLPCGKVIFYTYLHSVHRGVSAITPVGRHTPGHTPRQTPPPLGRHLPVTATAVDGMHPTGMHSC